MSASWLPKNENSILRLQVTACLQLILFYWRNRIYTFTNVLTFSDGRLWGQERFSFQSHDDRQLMKPNAVSLRSWASQKYFAGISQENCFHVIEEWVLLSFLTYLISVFQVLKTKDSNRSPTVVSDSGFQRRPLFHEHILTTSCSWLPRFFPHLADSYIVANKSGTVGLYVAYKLERGTDINYLMIYCVIFLWGREHKLWWGKGWGSLNELRRDADTDGCTGTS